MILEINRKLKLNKFIYLECNNNNYYGESNFTFGLLFRKLFVYDIKNHHTYKLVQSNVFHQLLYLCGLWILPIDLFPRYKMFFDDECIGKTKVSFFSPKRIICIGKNTYELCIHTNNYISIMKDDVQIALIKKQSLTEAEQNRYHIIYDDNKESNIGLLILLVVFIDIVYFPQKNRVSYYKYEKTIGKDKYASRILWNI